MGGADGTGRTKPTIYAAWTAWQGRLALVLLALLCMSGVVASINRSAPTTLATPFNPELTDVGLYRAVALRVGRGDDYYSAVVIEQRARHFPLKPFVTIRLPTLAWLTGSLGERGAWMLLVLLAAAATIGTSLRLRAVTGVPDPWVAATMLIIASAAPLVMPVVVWWHDAWAGLLIALSLACRMPGRWRASVAIGLVALLIRELALPYLCLMAALAWWEGQRREAIAWAGAILIFLAALATHATLLAPYVTGADATSAGWSSAGGLPFVLSLVRSCTIMTLLPLPAIAITMPLALLGWSGLKGDFGRRVALLLGGYLFAFLSFGRPDNFYWGLTIAPLLATGLAFAPYAVRDLVGVALGPAGARIRPVA